MAVALGVAGAMGARGAAAQDTTTSPSADSTRRGPAASALVTLGSVADERFRLAQTLGTASTAGYLLRTPSGLGVPVLRTRRGVAVSPLFPELFVVNNSALATKENDGALWAGRGANLLVRAGIAARAGPVTLVLDPEFTFSANAPYQTLPTTLLGQYSPVGPFAAPWFTGPYSADLPLRFGDQSFATVGFGQSALYATVGPVDAGVSSENQWWGPAVQNALLLGNAAPGFPHAFVRTAHPIRTGIGDVEARWILGGLTESLFFTTPAGRPPGRALNGLVATLRLRADTGLTIGAARLVLTALGARSAVLWHAFDVLSRNADLGVGDSLTTPRSSDQLASVFARWVFPRGGAEVYGEFARSELPRSPRDFLIAPLNTGAYTLGFAKAFATMRGRAVRANLELTDLEQTRRFTDRPPPPDYYTGRGAPAGFTNRGQVLGAAIGPGSQSQWLSVDYYTPGGQLGVFAQRVRNQNDALYRQPFTNQCRHDVTLSGGARGGLRLPGVDALASIALSNRLDYLFQSGCANYLSIGTVDVRNVSLKLSVSPRGRRGAP